MRTRNALRCCAWILSAYVLTGLASCGSTKVVTRTVTVEVKVPVFVPLPDELVQVRFPRFLYPADSLPIAALDDKIEALELALGQCNNDKELIRAAQPKLPQ